MRKLAGLWRDAVTARKTTAKEPAKIVGLDTTGKHLRLHVLDDEFPNE